MKPWFFPFTESGTCVPTKGVKDTSLGIVESWNGVALKRPYSLA